MIIKSWGESWGELKVGLIVIIVTSSVLIVGERLGLWSPWNIHEAVDNGSVEAVMRNLDEGTNVNAKDDQEKTPLLRAAYYGHKEIADLLIEKGADVNAKDNQGTTSLFISALKGHNEVVELLIANGADVNTQIEKVLDATDLGSSEIIIVLTPLDMAEDEKTIDLLRKHGGKTGEELKAEGK